MTNGIRGLLMLCGASALAAEARADWQYTRWGMTPDEVVAAANGAARLGAPPQGKTYEGFTGRALGRHEADGASFDAYFHFDAAGGLAKVALERTGGAACADLHRGLGARHGRPAKSTRNAFATVEEWRDAAGGNLVRYVLIGELPCTVTFDRLPPG
jgi:hypothetical protein